MKKFFCVGEQMSGILSKAQFCATIDVIIMIKEERTWPVKTRRGGTFI